MNQKPLSFVRSRDVDWAESSNSMGNCAQTEEALQRRAGLGELCGESSEMQVIYALIERVAQHDFPVLIVGESGTGKELVARAIHNLGPRVNNRLTSVDCSALSPTLFESEMFGHTKGSFTGATDTTRGLFQISQKGTLFLDEIAEMPTSLQCKLLRVMQDSVVRQVGSTEQIRVDVRVIAATNRDMSSAIQDGSFRQDLFYRINVVQINVPPLRDRKCDIPLLANHFVKRFTDHRAGTAHTISDETMERLLVYDWPGNVRELEHAIQRAIALSSKVALKIDDLLPEVMHPPKHLAAKDCNALAPLAEIERVTILRAIQTANGDIPAAARLLSMGKTTIYRKLKLYRELKLYSETRLYGRYIPRI